MSFIVLNLDTTAPNIIVAPASGTIAPIPIEIYITSDEFAIVYYTLDGSDPVIGAPNTFQHIIPFVFNITTAGSHVIKYMTLDDVGNLSPVGTLTYYATYSFSLYSVSPRTGPTTGGTVITVTGEGFNYGAVILINDEPIPTEYGGEHRYLYGKTLPMPEGAYNVQVNDPQNGLSVILMGAFTFIEPQYEDRIIETPMKPGETRKHMFETDKGTMVLSRTLVADFSIDNLTELRIKDLCVKNQISQAYDTYPQKVNLE